jgi:minimal PKS chain-length factor (CLF/KS beta)
VTRAVISGIGIVAPNGLGTASYWNAARKGISGIRPIERFSPAKFATQVAGTVQDFEVTDYIGKRLSVQTDHWTWMALAATQMALADARFDPQSVDEFALSVVTASSSGGNQFGQREIQNLWSKGPNFVGAYQSIAWFYAATTGQISILHGCKGPCGVVVTEQAGGLDSLAEARRQIRQGGVTAVMAGGTESPIGPYALACQERNGMLAPGADPDIYRPFDIAARGYVPGEGGAILLVESAHSAAERGVPHAYAEVAGHAATQDAYHHTLPAPDGRQLARAMSLALRDAGVEPDQVDAVFADGLGLPDADAAEVRAMHAVFGERAASVPVTVPKSMTGRLYAGGSSLDAATAALALASGELPPTINFAAPAPRCDLDIVTQTRSLPLQTVLVAARGVGGFNSALVLRKTTG